MRSEPASQSASKPTSARQIALVLADPGIGEILCDGLRAEGFETRLQPPPPLSISTEDLRSLLRDFVAREGTEGDLWVHPGITPIAERSEWPALGRELGFSFIGPPARSLSMFNNRLNLLGEAEKISISNLLLMQDPLHSVREIEKLIRNGRFKLPFVLKTVRGGSGYGVRVIHQPEDLGKSLGLWLEQIRRNLGEVFILAEKYVEGARRIVQPFVRYSDGQIELLPSSDASLTSRLRKLVEFCPAHSMDENDTHFKLVREWTKALAHRTGYVGVGTLEFLVDGERTFLIEGVPRLNTGFYLWEKVAGVSAVGLQLAAQRDTMARSESRASRVPDRKGDWRSAVGVRIHAEDPILQLPQPGTIVEVMDKREWSFPGAEAKLNLAVSAKQEITYADSSVLGYLWVGAEDRKRAMTVARGLLDELWIAGSIQTNERFLHELVSHPWVQEGMFHASFVDEEFIPSVRPDADVLRVFVRMAQLLSDAGTGAASQSKWAVGDQWIKVTDDQIQWKVEPSYFSYNGKRGISGMIKSERGQAMRAFCFPLTEDRWQARVGNWFFPVRRVPPKAPNSKLNLTALLVGRVHSILYREGSWVPAHEAALIMESMGMLVPHALPVDVRIVRWHVQAEDEAHTGQILAEFERATQVR